MFQKPGSNGVATAPLSITSLGAAPGQSRGLLAYLKSRIGGLLGSATTPAAAAEADDVLRGEKVRAGPSGMVLPWFLPFFDPAQVLYETQEQRIAYRKMLASPAVKAAILGKLLAVSALNLQIIPADKRDRDAGEHAEFVKYNMEESLSGGVPGMVWSIGSGGLIDGYSVSEKVLDLEDRGEYRHKLTLRALKPKDTGKDLVLETDHYRNVVGLKGLRYNPGMMFHPAKFVIYRHLPLWDVPTGMSDLRAAYGSWWMLDTVRKLRAIGLEKRAMPVLMGTFQTAQQRPSLEQALAMVKSQNWLAIPEGVRVEALNIAGSADATFAEAVKDLTHEIFLSIAGAVLQSLEGTMSDARGNSQVHRSTADLFIWHLAQAIEQVLNDRTSGLVRDLVDLNYANIERYPKAKLSAVDVDEQLRELEIDRGLWSMGVSLSKEEVGDRYGRKPPVSKGDAITPQSGQQAAVGEVKREPGLQVDDKEALELDGAGEGDRSGEGDTAEHFSEGLHRFASTQFDLASDDADAVLSLAARIDDDDLAGDGREGNPHITIKYGLHDDDPAAVRNAIAGFGPVKVRLGPVSVFPARDEDGADVVKIEVQGAAIRRLNKAVCDACQHTNTHAGYSPHLTLAYVKPGHGAKYAGKHPLQGREITFDTLLFSPRDREKIEVPLGGRFADAGDTPFDGSDFVDVSAFTPRANPRRYDEPNWDEKKHPRKGGQFAPKGSGSPSSSVADEGHATATPTAFAKPLSRLGGMTAATKAATNKVGAAAWKTLSSDEQKAVTVGHAAGAWLYRRAETLLTKGKQMVGEAAKNRGLSEEQVARAKRIVGVVDQVLAWTVNMPAATLATGNPFVGKASGFLPVASMAYLAYSMARDPWATLKAAWTTLTTKADAHAEEIGQGDVEAFLDGLEAAEDPDAYEALVLAAFDHTGDFGEAITLAGGMQKHVEDEEGHEHANDGKFAPKGGGGDGAGGKPDRKAAHEQARAAHQQAMKDHGLRVAKRDLRRQSLDRAEKAADAAFEAGHAALKADAIHPDEVTKILAGADAGRVVSSLQAADASDRDLSKVTRAVDRGKAGLARAAKAYQSKHEKMQKLAAKVPAAEPEPVRADSSKWDAIVADRSIEADDPRNLEAEKAIEDIDDAHDKAQEAWEEKQSKRDDAQSKVDEASEAVDEAGEDLREAWSDHWDGVTEAVNEASSNAHDAITEEEDADEEPEEPKDDDDEEGDDEDERFGEGDWDEKKHPRSHGKFAPKGSGGTSGKPKDKAKGKPAKTQKDTPSRDSGDTEDAAANRPTRPEERHKNEDGSEKTPPSLPEKLTPPPPRGESKAPRNAEGKPVTGYSANGIANTYTGDLVEDALGKLQLRNILPPGKRSHAPGEVKKKGSSLDREYDHSGHFFEVKTVCVEGSEYKAKPKASEMEDKRRFAKIHQGKAGTMIVIMDTDNLAAHAYWRDGIGAFAINPKKMDDWNYAGSVQLDSDVIAEARRKTEAGKEKRKGKAKA